MKATSAGLTRSREGWHSFIDVGAYREPTTSSAAADADTTRPKIERAPAPFVAFPPYPTLAELVRYVTPPAQFGEPGWQEWKEWKERVYA
jgi:hypothetical protein